MPNTMAEEAQPSASAGYDDGCDDVGRWVARAVLRYLREHLEALATSDIHDVFAAAFAPASGPASSASATGRR